MSVGTFPAVQANGQEGGFNAREQDIAPAVAELGRRADLPAALPAQLVFESRAFR